MPTPCYLLEPTETNRRWLRRYAAVAHDGWTCADGWHHARTPIADAPVIHHPAIAGAVTEPAIAAFLFDPRWPTHCEEGCGYAFTDEDRRQVFTRRVYRVTDALDGAALPVGAEATLEDAPPGAQWYADWMGEWAQGSDGRTLVVKLPDGHEWMIDSEAKNCTRPGDRSHRCWLRHGVPPLVTVGKDGGETCKAGAGSIASPGYHGFLHSGVLT